MIGKTLIHYEITAEIGRGGMGEVYQAKDTKLGREVAIKVLPEEFAMDHDRVARFQREAKLLASLNHPNIAAIYGLEESEGTHFLVMELIEGDTLRDRIKSGPIPVEEALKLALQMAEALEAAHEKEVIHRDLKPANIKVTPDGKVKVLDFGLAKAYAGDQGNINLADSPTISAAATQQGVILGTAAYMSPEQARGKPVDKRADIWAFGVVLYEMLTGKSAFPGDDVTDTLAAVICSEPEWKSLPANLHWRLREVQKRCLEKKARDRYGSISDARVDIQKVLADPDGVYTQPRKAVEPHKKVRTIVPWITVLLLVGIIVGLGLWKSRVPEPQIIRFDYDLPEGQQFTRIGFPVLAISPDGKQFVYATSKGLYLRSLDEWKPSRISGTEESTESPFFSPNGKWVGYFSIGDQKLKKISIDGGAPVNLCDVAGLVGAHWYKEDTIVYGQTAGDIMLISDKGGSPESLVKVQGNYLGLPQILPDGKTILYTAWTATDARIMMQSLVSGNSEELFEGVCARYLPTGHIVYGLPNNNSLFAVPFDLDRLEVTGGVFSAVEGVLLSAADAHNAISDSGTLIYVPGSAIDPNNQRTLVWVDRNGHEEPVGAQPMFYKYPNISPDGTKVAVTDYAVGMPHHIYILDLDRETLKKLTFERGDNLCPVWAPDGERIAFWSGELYCKAAAGTGQAEKLSEHLIPYCWSRDGKTIVGVEMSSTLDDEDIGMLSIEGDLTQKTLLRRAPLERSPKISLDGQLMAYTSNVSGREEVYVRPFPEVDKGQWQVSQGGGAAPLWSPDGRELFYLNGDEVMMVSVKTDPSFDIVGTPQTIFRGTFIGPYSGEGTPWDIHPKSKRFLMIKPGEYAEPPRKINIVLNWLEELKQRAPVD
jgi:serine/threonine protein kinase